MRPSTTTLLGCLLAALPLPGAAQGFTLTPFTAVDGGMAPAPRTVGLSATAWWGATGFRAGGAVDAASSPVAPLLGYPPAAATAAWSMDGDLVLSGARAGVSLLGVSPSVFVGFGAHGRRREDGSTRTIPTWSYGGGLSVPLLPRLSVDAEARYRMPHESDDRLLPPDVGGGLEVRAGLSLHLGAIRAPARGEAARAPTIRMGSTVGTPAGSRPGPEDPAPSSRSASAAAVAVRVIDDADDHVGVRYTWGGNSPADGFDCSGFVKYVFAGQGIRLPRVSRDQRWAGREVAPVVSALLPGDLMFYAGSDGVVNHVAIYAGDGRIIHSSSSGRGVRIDDLSTRRGRYYATRMVAARRVIPDGGAFRLR